MQELAHVHSFPLLEGHINEVFDFDENSYLILIDSVRYEAVKESFNEKFQKGSKVFSGFTSSPNPNFDFSLFEIPTSSFVTIDKENHKINFVILKAGPLGCIPQFDERKAQPWWINGYKYIDFDIDVDEFDPDNKCTNQLRGARVHSAPNRDPFYQGRLIISVGRIATLRDERRGRRIGDLPVGAINKCPRIIIDGVLYFEDSTDVDIIWQNE